MAVSCTPAQRILCISGRWGRDFSEEKARRVTATGSKLVEKAGGFAKDVAQILKIRTDGMRRNAEFVGKHGYLYPAILDSAGEVFKT